MCARGAQRSAHDDQRSTAGQGASWLTPRIADRRPDKPVQPDELPLLEAIGITKLFGDFVANDHINLEIWPAEIHALLGENGAGKSTLVKIIYGLLQPTAGEIRWQGEPVVLADPAAARALGIGMVFQHFSLFEH